MKKVNFLFLIGILMSSLLVACDKEDVKEDEGLGDEQTEVEISEPKQLVVTKGMMGNQYNYNFNTFYNLKEGKTFSDSTMDADFAFLSFNQEVKFILTRSGEILDSTKQTLDKKGKFCSAVSKATNFYKLPKSFRTADFDTLKSVAALESLIEKSKLSTLPVTMAQGYFYSDEYGWSDGTMVGLKDEEGNVGILKMEDFNTTINEEGIELVSMRITVKYDKPE